MERLAIRFAEIDIHLGKLIAKLSRSATDELRLAAEIASFSTREGNTCFALKDFAGKVIVDEKRQRQIILPALEKWDAELKQSSCVGKPHEFKPLILDDKQRLYLHRYWSYENELADFIKARLAGGSSLPLMGNRHHSLSPCPLPEGESTIYYMKKIRKALAKIFPSNASGVITKKVDWQKVAAVLVIFKNFVVISGSPGTGKTTTVARIIAVLAELSPDTPLRIALAAPTGKAAFRLETAIKDATEAINCDETIKKHIPSRAVTIHRLLGIGDDISAPKYNQKNHLPYDVIFIDEASMIDLPLMVKLTRAVAPKTKLILLGDKHQLASVEPGSVFGDITTSERENVFSPSLTTLISSCTGGNYGEAENTTVGAVSLPPSGFSEEHAVPVDDGETKSPIAENIIELKDNYRFGANHPVGTLGLLVNAGKANKAITLLKELSAPPLKWVDTSDIATFATTFKSSVLNSMRPYLNALKANAAPNILFALFAEFRVLCVVKNGPFGVNSINERIIAILKEEKYITNRSNELFHGCPIIISKNDYQQNLFNGDIGIVLFDDEANDLRAYFRHADRNMRAINPQLLSSYETAFAMTTHKSQGSEFEKMMFLLPEIDSPLLTREIIYTGITRIKKELEIWGTENIFAAAVTKRISRTSALRELLLSL